jgi:transcriptional regulator with XRE-family HTH domain
MTGKGVGKMIQAYRRRSGLTQEQLAEKTGLPLRSVQNWEAGHRTPRPMALLALARVLGTTVEELLTGRAPAPKKASKRRGRP